MTRASGRHTVADEKPLNQRWRGYDVDAVASYWAKLHDAGRRAEQRFLELDLVFPTWYGGALAVSLATASSPLGVPIPVGLLLAPVAVTVLADWTENLVQLDQLRRYIESPDTKAADDALQPDRIRVASVATIVKLVCFTIASLEMLVILTSRAPGDGRAPRRVF
jgi:hypothetical protein